METAKFGRASLKGLQMDSNAQQKRNLIERAIFPCMNFGFAECSHVEDEDPQAGLFFETLVRVTTVTINKTRDAYYELISGKSCAKKRPQKRPKIIAEIAAGNGAQNE